MSLRIDNKVGRYSLPQQPQAEQAAQQTQRARRIDLNQFSTYEKVTAVTFDDGTSVAVPQLAEAQAVQLRSIYAGLSAAQAAELRASGRNLGNAVNNALDSEQAHTADGQINLQWVSGEVNEQARHAFTTYMVTTGDRDFEQSMAGVMLMGTEELQDVLGDFAGRVQASVETQRDMRSDIADMREVLTNWPEGAATQPFTWTERLEDGTVVEHVDEPLTEAAARDLMDRMESELENMREMTELDKFRLQDLYQRYNQAITTLSNILKMEHDTLKGIIGNLK